MVRLPFLSQPRHKDQRVVVLIDIQNLYHSAKHLFNGRVNFSSLVEVAAENRKLVRAIGYVVRSGSEEELTFFEALKSAGIEIRVKDLQVFYGGVKKADWDVGITLDAISIAPAVDVVVLASGDGDFAPLVEKLRHSGKIVEVLAFAKSSSSKLKEVCDDFIDLGENPRRFILKK